MSVEGNIVDVVKNTIFPGKIEIENGKIVDIKDEDITSAVNEIISMGGGLAYVEGSRKKVLPLPIAGLMSYEKGEKVAFMHEKLKASVESTLSEPFGTLSFQSLRYLIKVCSMLKNLNR